jgi:hypothetical protein
MWFFICEILLGKSHLSGKFESRTSSDDKLNLQVFGSILVLDALSSNSAVAILLAQGVNVRTISEILGHSSVSFTLQVYGHLLADARREAADKMKAVLAL